MLGAAAFQRVHQKRSKYSVFLSQKLKLGCELMESEDWFPAQNRIQALVFSIIPLLLSISSRYQSFSYINLFHIYVYYTEKV